MFVRLCLCVCACLCAPSPLKKSKGRREKAEKEKKFLNLIKGSEDCGCCAPPCRRRPRTRFWLAVKISLDGLAGSLTWPTVVVAIERRSPPSPQEEENQTFSPLCCRNLGEKPQRAATRRNNRFPPEGTGTRTVDGSPAGEGTLRWGSRRRRRSGRGIRNKCWRTNGRNGVGPRRRQLDSVQQE